MPRYTAGLFEAPPAIERAIQDWMASVYAGHVLAKTLSRLITLQDSIAPARDALERILAVEKVYEQKIRDIGRGKSIRLEIPIPDASGPKDYFVGVRRSENEGVLVYQVGQGHRNVSYKSNWTTLYEAIRQVQMVVDARIAQASRVIRYLERNPPQSSYKENTIRVELNLLRRECLKYTDRPKAFAAVASKMFPVDLTGWKYISKSSPIIEQINHSIDEYNRALQEKIEHGKQDLKRAQDFYDSLLEGKVYSEAEISRLDREMKGPLNQSHIRLNALNGNRPSTAYALVPVPSQFNSYMVTHTYIPIDDVRKMMKVPLGPNDLMKALAVKGWDQIKVVLDFKGHSSRGGVWLESKRELQVDAKHTSPLTVKEFYEGIDWLMETARHEVQHVGQSLLGEIQGLPEIAGLPSKALRDPSVDPHGISQTTNKPQTDHALRDIEFHTDLTDSIRQFTRLVRSVRPHDRADALRQFVGLPPKNLFVGEVPPDPHFRLWKAKAPDKWKKAVSELVKAIGEQGVRIRPL